MKKVFLFFAITIISFANAQKGTVLLAGSIGYNNVNNSNTNSGSTNNYFNFSPKIGYQIADNWTVGLESSFYNWKGKTDQQGYASSESKNSTSNYGAFLRYSKPLIGIFSTYVDLSAGLSSGKNSSTNNTDVKNNGYYTNLMPAISLNLKKGFALNFSIGGLGYSSTKDNQTVVNTKNSFYFNFGQQPTIGISKNF